jgi:hypothetical protein
VRNQLQNTNRGGQGLQPNRSPYEPRPRYNPPVCALCGNRSIRPFSSIYGGGTAFYTRIKGLIFKHGYERTKRQSVLAENCRPPMKVPWSPAILSLLALLAMKWGGSRLPLFSGLFDLASYYVGWVALLLTIVAGVNNWGFYPQKMRAWSRKFYCDRCGGCTVLEQ